MRLQLVVAFSLGLSLALASAAHANGRPPLTNGIHFQPNDPHSLYVATTFGLLVSHDDGCTMSWVCEQNIGYGGEWDPKYAIGTDGTIFATTYTGLRVSHDGGCSFVTATSELAPGSPNRIADVWIDALDVGPTGLVWVGTAESGQPNEVYLSSDNGVTFNALGLNSSTIFWKSLRAAPSNLARAYVSGYEVAPPTAHILRTDNMGGMWTPSPLTNVVYGSTPLLLIMAVDPTNSDIVFMISQGSNNASGDRLYRSADAGMTWTDGAIGDDVHRWPRVQVGKRRHDVRSDAGDAAARVPRRRARWRSRRLRRELATGLPSGDALDRYRGDVLEGVAVRRARRAPQVPGRHRRIRHVRSGAVGELESAVRLDRADVRRERRAAGRSGQW